MRVHKHTELSITSVVSLFIKLPFTEIRGSQVTQSSDSPGLNGICEPFSITPFTEICGSQVTQSSDAPGLFDTLLFDIQYINAC